jgi:hypothetical protein
MDNMQDLTPVQVALVEELVRVTLQKIPADLMNVMAATMMSHGFVIGDNAMMEAKPNNLTDLQIDGVTVMSWKPMMVNRYDDGSLGFHWHIMPGGAGKQPPTADPEGSVILQ